MKDSGCATLRGEIPENFTIAPVTNTIGHNMHYRMTDVDTGRRSKNLQERKRQLALTGVSSPALLAREDGAQPRVE